MKFFTLLVLLGVYQVASAQTATVTATVVDAQGCPYSNATYNFNLIDQNGNDITPGYIVYQGGIPFTVPNIQGTMDGFGKMTQVGVLLNNVLTSPQNTQWNISVCSQNPAFFPGNNIPRMQCFHGGPWTITGNRDLSSELSALAPPLGCNSGGGGGVSSFRTQALDPIFNSAPTSPTTGAVAQTFTLQNADPFDVLGNFAGVPAPWDKWQLVAGNNITITPDGTAKTVTFASSSPLTLTSTDPIKLNSTNGPYTSGTVDVECPTCGTPQIQMNAEPPTTGNYVVLYPSTQTYGGNPYCAGWNTANPTGYGVGFPIYSGLFPGGICNNTLSGWVDESGNPWPMSGYNPANVTAVYAVAIAGWTPGSIYNGGGGYAGQTLAVTCASTGLSINPTTLAQTSALTSLAGSGIAAATCTETITTNSSIGKFVNAAAMEAPVMALYVYTTDAPTPSSTALNVGPYLNYDRVHNLLTTQNQFPQWLYPSAIANLDGVDGHYLQVVSDSSNTSTAHCVAGGSTVALAMFNSADGTWWCTPVGTGGGGGGSVTEVDTGTGLTGGPITNTGTISCVDATSSNKGCVQVDGTTITATGGVISAAAGGGGLSGQTTNYLPKATSATTSTTSSIVEDQGTGIVIHGTATSHGITVPEATPISGVASSDVLTADSTTHRWLQNPNNAGATVIPGTSTTAATAGNCVKYAANGYDITDAGAACGTGGGGTPSGTNGVIQIANTAGTAFDSDSTIAIDKVAHTLNIGTLPSNHVTIGALGTPTSWTFDTTSPSTAALSACGGTGAAGKYCDGSTGNWTTMQLSTLATQAADTVVMNSTGSTAAPSAVAMPTCTSGADLYNTSTHSWSCVSTSGGGNYINLGSAVTWTNCSYSIGVCAVSGTSTTSVTISSIPSTYIGLEIIVFGGATTAAVNLTCQFNSDTGANYASQRLVGANTTANAYFAGSQTASYCGEVGASGFSGTTHIYIPFYANSSLKKTYHYHATSFNSISSGTAAYQELGEAAWNSTAAINSVAIQLANFSSGTSFVIYGVN